VVSGSSGSGKTSLLRELLAIDSRLGFSISYTTRKPRPYEVHGEHYVFVSLEEFQRLLQEGRLVEWVEQFGYYYGTSKDWLDQALTRDQDLIFDLEIHGAREFKRLYPEATFIFIMPPSWPELERRLRQRGSLPEAELRERLRQTQQDWQEVDWYDYLVVNDDFFDALNQLAAIVKACRCRTPYLWPQIKPRFQSKS